MQLESIENAGGQGRLVSAAAVVGMSVTPTTLVRYGEIPTRDPLRHEIGCRVKESNQSFCVLAVVMLTHTMNDE